jgi:putative hydrolase of the HAD superfamily
MLRGILFDLGDTILDFDPMDGRQVFRDGATRVYELLKPRLPKSLSLDEYCRGQYGAVRRAYLWAKLIGREFDSVRLMCRCHAKLGVRLEPETQLEMVWAWYQALLAHASIADDVVPTLRTLRAMGLKLGLVSNTFIPPATHDRHLQQSGLLEFFPVRVYSSEVRYRKPHRRIFQVALSRLGTAAHQTLFVGDLIRDDIRGARRMGMKTALRRRAPGSDHPGVADFAIRYVSELTPLVARLCKPCVRSTNAE